MDILDKHAPVTRIKVKGNSLPYVTSELKALIRTRDYLRAKLANKTGSICLRKAFNHVRNKVNKALSDLQQSYYAQRTEENKDNLKGTWKILKQAIGQGTKSTNMDKVIYEGSIQIASKLQISIINILFLLEGSLLKTSQIRVSHQLPISKLPTKRLLSVR